MHIKRWIPFLFLQLFFSLLQQSRFVEITQSFRLPAISGRASWNAYTTYEINGMSLKCSDCIHVFIVQFKTTSITMTRTTRTMLTHTKTIQNGWHAHINIECKNYDKWMGKSIAHLQPKGTREKKIESNHYSYFGIHLKWSGIVWWKC